MYNSAVKSIEQLFAGEGEDEDFSTVPNNSFQVLRRKFGERVNTIIEGNKVAIIP
jgi:hypothetical protein